jgi:plasmid stabilization system protein ParE
VNRLRVLPEAEEELSGAANWYESKRPGLGVELIAVVDRSLLEIQEAPLACALWRIDRPYRAKVLSRFPYVVFYRAEGQTIEVVAVAHAKRWPGYWLKRS